MDQCCEGIIIDQFDAVDGKQHTLYQTHYNLIILKNMFKQLHTNLYVWPQCQCLSEWLHG